jgi:hypothetical protein
VIQKTRGHVPISVLKSGNCRTDGHVHAFSTASRHLRFSRMNQAIVDQLAVVDLCPVPVG